MLWLKHGEIITSHRATVAYTSDSHDMLSLTLEMVDLVPGDSDEYSCRVTNGNLGVKAVSVNITVNGRQRC